MNIPPFRLERFFAQHEFSARYLLSASDCETCSLDELLAMASPESLALWEGLRFGYTESQGHPLLREEAASLYECADADGILIAVPEEAIFVFMHALLRPGDHAVVVTPAYQSLYQIAASAGCEVTRLALRPEAGGWKLDLDELVHCVNRKTRLIVVNFPHNPTGYMPSPAEFEEIVAIARRHGAYLFGDEMYRMLEFDESRRLPPACDAYEKGVTLSGLSKAYGLPGLRLGWLAMQDRGLLERAMGIKDYTTICQSAPSEILGLIGLRARDAILRRNREILGSNLEAARAFFTGRPEVFRWIDPRGGPVAFPEWMGEGTVDDFCRRALDESGVLIAHGALFEHPGQHFRVGMGRRNFPEALAALAA